MFAACVDGPFLGPDQPLRLGQNLYDKLRVCGQRRQHACPVTIDEFVGFPHDLAQQLLKGGGQGAIGCTGTDLVELPLAIEAVVSGERPKPLSNQSCFSDAGISA